VYVPGTVNADEQQMSGLFSFIGKAIGSVVKLGESALGIGTGGTKQVQVTLAPNQPVAAAIVPKPNALDAAAAEALGVANTKVGAVPAWVWIAGAGVGGIVLMSLLNGRRR